MAEANISIDQNQFVCSICLDLLKDPVTINCGHSFCMLCINDYWNQQDQKESYSCPQCRETFKPRPVLRRNNVMAEVVEQMKKTELQDDSPADAFAKPGDVECDLCSGRKHKAIKSCLTCLASYCGTHVNPHYHLPAFKKHNLVEALTNLHDMICCQHDKLIEIYCRTDQCCICYLCTMDEHKGHDTVSAAAERKQKENDIKELQRKYQQKLQEKQKKVQDVKQAVDTIKSAAQQAVKETDKIFAEMICSIEKKCCELADMIREQERAELSQAEGLLAQLEQEISDLKERDKELEELFHTKDHVHFLQGSIQSLSMSAGSEDTTSITIKQHISFDGVKKSLSAMKEQVEKLCNEDFSKISSGCPLQRYIDPQHIYVLDKVRVKPSVTKPVGMWRFAHDSIGRVQAFRACGKEVIVNFPNRGFRNPQWTGPMSELELVPSLHHDTVCDGCFMEPLKGPRFKCRNCNDFDLCESCFRTFDHNTRHSFGRINEPENQKILYAGPKIREDLLKYHCSLTLDPNTAHSFLVLTENNRVVTMKMQVQSYSYHPERFDGHHQVLSNQSITGRCYWEVKLKSEGWCIYLAVTYKGISRKGKGDESVFGRNNQSWCLKCFPTLSFCHNNNEIELPELPSSRIGVYVDHSAGILSFYRVTGKMTLIHRVQTRFTQPLYAGFTLGYKSSVKLCNPKCM